MPEDHRDTELEALLRTLDHAPPSVTADHVIARAGRTRSRVRWAAGIAVGLGVAGAAYALPGSPLPAWVDAAAEWVGLAGSPRQGVRATRPDGEDAGPAGIAFDAGESVVVVFRSPSEGYLRVVPATDSLVVIEAPAGAARFTSEPGRLLIDPLSPDTFELRLPASTARVEVLADGRRVFLKEGQRVSAGTAPGPDGSYLLPLAAPR